MKGFRIHGIVRELRNENIDVINFTNNTNLYIQRALSPAKINSITVKEEEHRAEVFLNPEEVSLAIGKGGANIKLASMLTGYNIEVFRDIDEVDEEDIYLDEFRDEIDGWVIDQLKRIGCSTAKNVLATNRERLIREADLEESTVDEILAILRYEFEDEAAEEADAETDTLTDMDTDYTETAVDLEADMDADTDMDTDIDMDADAEIDPDTDVDADAEMNAETDVDAEDEEEVK